MSNRLSGAYTLQDIRRGTGFKPGAQFYSDDYVTLLLAAMSQAYLDLQHRADAAAAAEGLRVALMIPLAGESEAP